MLAEHVNQLASLAHVCIPCYYHQQAQLVNHSPHSPVSQVQCCRFAALPMTQSFMFQLCDLTHTELQQMLRDPVLAACCSEKSGKVPQSLSKPHCPCTMLKLHSCQAPIQIAALKLAVPSDTLERTFPVRIGMQAGTSSMLCVTLMQRAVRDSN